MAAQHSPRFLQIVQDARSRIRELTALEVKARLDRGEQFHLIDVREESEWNKDHLPGALHLGKGVIERDVEGRVPDTGAAVAASAASTSRLLASTGSLLSGARSPRR